MVSIRVWILCRTHPEALIKMPTWTADPANQTLRRIPSEGKAKAKKAKALSQILHVTQCECLADAACVFKPV